MNPILMIAYHYPPEGSSSGVLRTLKFSKYLPDYGWLPHVLTLRESAYSDTDRALLGDVPSEAVVHRTRGFDSARYLSVKGRHLAMLSVPDRFVSWLPFGVARGLRVIRRAGIRALYSTSPQPTAHLIAAALASLTRLPWIADFRDPWIEEGLYPAPGTLRYRVEAALEALVMRRAARVTVTTEHFRRDLLARYPRLSPGRIVAIFNGYDEDDFAGLDCSGAPTSFEILHTGLVTPEYRDPFPLLRAVKTCFDQGRLDRAQTKVAFLGGGTYVASVDFRDKVHALGLADLVRVVDRLPYRATLQRMVDAAVLLLLQASGDTRALIPAKAFEYLRVKRPILALTLEGATADLVRDTAAGLVADPRDAAAVEAALATLFCRWRAGAPRDPFTGSAVRRFERRLLTGQLAAVLGELVPQSRLTHTPELAPSTT